MAEGDENKEEQGSESMNGEGLDPSQFDMILDIPLKLSVVLGGCKLNVKDLIDIEKGSVVELDNLAGEPLKVYINNKLVAWGTAVVVNEKFGIKLTNIISKNERLAQFYEE